jgi:hypothetical protein
MIHDKGCIDFLDFETNASSTSSTTMYGKSRYKGLLYYC